MIYLKNYWIRNNVVQTDYIDDGYILLTYIGLRIIQKEDKPTQIVSVDDIIEEVYGTEVSSPIRIKIIDSIFLLAEFGKIEIIRNIGKRNNKWELDISKLWIDTSKGDFTMVEQSEIQRLLQLPNRNRIALLRYYLVLLSTMTNGVGNQSLARIRGLVSVSKKMQIEYNKLLDELNYQLGEEDEEEEFVIDREHLEKVLEDRRIRGRQQQLKELNEERQRYEEAIREEEIIIAKLRERNADQSVIDEELTIVDKNKQNIEELDKQINELKDT